MNNTVPCDRIPKGSLREVARTAWSIAEEENRQLDKIDQLLQRDDVEGAVAEMRNFFGRPKPVGRVLPDGTEENRQSA